ncbi:hypothetical protein [Burkholderia pyrrocinia]|uniref:hypothetical protein n=1 Tax=Burkholderia pyrrocinia TaxID=60550 RepID=UPI002AB077F5|nr:hypothetical protein [Burkholderia pyrrocinia]
MKILFLGGSFLSDGDIPGRFLELVKLRFPTVETLQHTFKQARLSQHLNDAHSLELLATPGLSVVLLQEQSKLHFTDYREMDLGVRLINERIIRIGAKPILLMTWRRRESLCDDGAFKKIYFTYTEIAERHGITLSPVGVAWELFRRNFPEADLMQSSNSHASSIGATVAASCIARTLLGSLDQVDISNVEIFGLNELAVKEVIDHAHSYFL